MKESESDTSISKDTFERVYSKVTEILKLLNENPGCAMSIEHDVDLMLAKVINKKLEDETPKFAISENAIYSPKERNRQN